MREGKTSLLRVVVPTIFIAILISVIPIHAADYTVGVKQGDWIKYGEFHASVTGTGTGVSEIAEMDNMDWMKIEVKAITGTEITVETTGAYKNGTAAPARPASEINLATGSGSYSNLFVLLTGADLKEGDDAVPPHQSGLVYRINGTVTRTYAGAMRSVNYIDLSASANDMNLTVKWYWDKATGIMVESFTFMSTTTPIATSMELSLKAVETNMWSAGLLDIILGNPIYLGGIVVVVVVVIAVAAVLITRRRKPTPTLTTPAPSPTPTRD